MRRYRPPCPRHYITWPSMTCKSSLIGQEPVCAVAAQQWPPVRIGYVGSFHCVYSMAHHSPPHQRAPAAALIVHHFGLARRPAPRPHQHRGAVRKVKGSCVYRFTGMSTLFIATPPRGEPGTPNRGEWASDRPSTTDCLRSGITLIFRARSVGYFRHVETIAKTEQAGSTVRQRSHATWPLPACCKDCVFPCCQRSAAVWPARSQIAGDPRSFYTKPNHPCQGG
jgi:hypothetical protein